MRCYGEDHQIGMARSYDVATVNIENGTDMVAAIPLNKMIGLGSNNIELSE